MKLFEDSIKNIDLSDPKFENTSKVHDWRNYVPEEWRKDWDRFTLRERTVIAVMAETQACNELWD